MGEIMSCSAVLGAQWGDEGKGKIVDMYSEQADVVVRYQGGHNAGHTVWVVIKKDMVWHNHMSSVTNIKPAVKFYTFFFKLINFFK